MTFRMWAAYTVTELVLSLTPGPAVLLVASHGMRRGTADASRAALGVVTGNAVYFVLSAAGLGAVLLASSSVFEAIRWAGVAYLVFLGLRQLRARPEPRDTVSPQPGRAFRRGLVVQLANPKAVIFFTALLPQFVTPGGDFATQFLILGVTTTALELPVLVAYGWLADRGRRLARGRGTAWRDRVAGTLLVATGLRLAAVRAG